MTGDNHWVSDYQDDPDYQFELLLLAVGEEIVRQLETLNISRKELAKRLGVSAPRVTQILAGDDNLTLKSLAAVAHALNATVRVTLTQRERVAEPEPTRETATVGALARA